MALESTPDAFRRLMALMPPDRTERLAKRLKFSGAQRKRAKAVPLDPPRRDALHAGRWAHALYGSDAQTILDQSYLDAADRLMPPEALHACEAFTATWITPVFPLSGDNLMELGLKPGPIFGALLKQVEAWWIDQDFHPTRQECFRELKRIWAERKGREL